MRLAALVLTLVAGLIAGDAAAQGNIEGQLLRGQPWIGDGRMTNGQTYKTAIFFGRTAEGLTAKWAKPSNPPGKVSLSGNNVSMTLKSDDGRDLAIDLVLKDGALSGTVKGTGRAGAGILQNELHLLPRKN